MMNNSKESVDDVVVNGLIKATADTDYIHPGELDEIEENEMRDLSEFFPTRFDEKRGCHVYYDNRLAREARVYHVINESRNMPCHCGSGRKYKKCCLWRDRREESNKTGDSHGK